MYTRNKIALLIENKIGYTNGRIVDDETYERECLMIADELIKLFPVVVVRSEQLIAFMEYVQTKQAIHFINKNELANEYLKNNNQWDGTTEY